MSGENQGTNVAVVVVGCVVVGFIGIFVSGILAAIAIPNFISMQYRTKRSEVPINLLNIKTALIQYEQNYDVYVRCRAYPPFPSGKVTQQWSPSSSGGFRVIGFQPDGDVRGSYMVSTSSTNFTVTGIIDVDGDGFYATYVATKSENPNSATTAPDVY